MVPRRRGHERLVGMLGVLLPLSAACLLAQPATGQQSPASSPPLAGQAGQALALALPAQSAPELAGCPLLPADNIWNVPVDTWLRDRTYELRRESDW